MEQRNSLKEEVIIERKTFRDEQTEASRELDGAVGREGHAKRCRRVAGISEKVLGRRGRGDQEASTTCPNT